MKNALTSSSEDRDLVVPVLFSKKLVAATWLPASRWEMMPSMWWSMLGINHCTSSRISESSSPAFTTLTVCARTTASVADPCSARIRARGLDAEGSWNHEYASGRSVLSTLSMSNVSGRHALMWKSTPSPKRTKSSRERIMDQAAKASKHASVRVCPPGFQSSLANIGKETAR